MPSDEQPTIPISPPLSGRTQAGRWEAPTVERMQAVLPQYEVLEILGRGGMGAVYKARQKSLKRLVAIKILPPEAADDEMGFVERFQNEAQTMAQMNHPAIVSVHDFGETQDGLFFFIMEYVDGTDVQKMIQAAGSLPGEHALAIAAHVCDALAYAHARGVIHRDIKPANILVNREGHIKVADFGLAKMHDPSQTSGLTRSNVALGTPDYVAPEVLTPGMIADHRADLYAVGVMLYQMLTGEIPRGMFKLPSRKVLGTDPRFDEIISKALETDREERYQSALDLRRALDVILTTPQARDDGTGIVPVAIIVQREPAKPTPRPTPQRVARSARASAAARPPLAARNPGPARRKFSTRTGLTIAGIVVAMGIAGIVILSGKAKPAAPAPVPVAKAPPKKPLPLDAEFMRTVAAAPAEKQVSLVGAMLQSRNGVKVTLEPKIDKGQVVELVLRRVGSSVPDLSPIAALKHLTALNTGYLIPADISWMRGLPLKTLVIWNGTFADISVLKELPLKSLIIRDVPIGDWSVLKGKPLERLEIYLCPQLRDISFVKGMPLTSLNVARTSVTDLSPLAGLPLTELTCNEDLKIDPALLRSLPRLEKINGRSVDASMRQPQPGRAAPAQVSSAWTDWMGPKFADPSDFLGSGWKREPDGLTTDLALKGTNIATRDERTGAIRVAFIIRDSQGVQIGARERKTGSQRELYFAQAAQDNFYLARMQPDGTVKRLASQKYPAAFDPLVEHTLEFSCVGSRLKATLDGTLVITSEDSALVQGPWSVVITKNALLKKVAFTVGDAKSSPAPASPKAAGSGAAATLPRNQWIPLQMTAEALKRNGIQGIVVKDGWLVCQDLINNQVDVLKLAGEVVDIRVQDLALRGIVRHGDEWPVVVNMRVGDLASDGLYSLDLFRNRLVLRCRGIAGEGTKGEVIILKEVLLPPAKAADGSLLLECSIQGTLIKASVDGSPVLEFRDDTLRNAGRFYLGCRAGSKGVAMRDVAIKLLDAPPPPADASAPASASAKGRTLDLLELVDVQRHALAGEWTRTGHELALKMPTGQMSGGVDPRVELPYEPPAEFDFEMEFTVAELPRRVGLLIPLPPGRSFSWLLATGKEGKSAGFELFDLKPTSQRTEVTAEREAPLRVGQRHRSRVEVRKGSLRAFLDGQELVNWSGRMQRLGDTSTLRGQHLGVRGYCPVTFHRIEVTEVTGTGKLDDHQ